MSKFRSVVALPLLVSCGLLAACSSSSTPAPDLATRLEQDTGTKWTVYTDPRSNEVRFLAPAKPVAIDGATLEEKTRNFFTRYGDSLHATRQSDELRIVSSAKDRRGGQHLRFAHVLPGTDLPVFDSGTTAHFTADGSVYWMQTDFRDDLASVDGNATVGRDAASATAVAHVMASCGAVHGAATAAAPELGVLSDPDTHAALAYRVNVSVQSDGCRAPSVFVDAKTGAPLKIEEGAPSIDALVRGAKAELLQVSSDQKTISVTGSTAASGTTYQMATAEAPNTRVISRVFGQAQPIQSSSLSDWDLGAPAKGSAVDGHFYSRQALQFLRPFASSGYEVHDRQYVYPLSLDLNVFVHDNSKNNSLGANAFASFDAATHTDNIHFGDGNFPAVPNAMPFTTAYDVVAHEITHLVTAHTSNLKYENESGALNESFSDVMGASAEHAVSPDDTKNLLIGEDLFFPGPAGMTALRSMETPSFDGSPAHVDEQRKCAAPPSDANDECFVHSNSGIPNRAFALIVYGGTVKQLTGPPGMQVSSDRPVAVSQGIGWEQATELSYWATTGLNATASFQNAALAQIAEAGLAGPAAITTVTCAWYAVGVLKTSPTLDSYYTSTYCTAPPPPNVPPPPSDPNATNVCSGHGDAVVCDPARVGQAVVCLNGFESTTEYCADLTQSCKPVSAGDPTAVLDNGVLVCE